MTSGKIKLISTSSHEKFAQQLADHLRLDLVPTKLYEFSNSNMMFKIKESIRESDVFIVSTQSRPVHKNLWETILAIDAAKRASAGRVTAVLPYFPYARSDQKDQPRISIGGRCFNSILETCGVDRVLTTDLHSDQIQAFFQPDTQCDQLRSADILCNYIKQNFNLNNYILVAPDPGAVKMVQRYQNKLKLDLAIIDKRRQNNKDEPIATNVVGKVKNKNCLIIDDEVSSGGTLMEAARLLKENDAQKIVSACVHPVLGGDAADQLSESKIDQLITTDTIPTNNKKFGSLSIVSVSKMFAQAIDRIHEGRSVSSIFE